VAAKFCFLKVASVKKHLRSVHQVDTSRIYGNDLYKGFMIRAQDGLLQRYLHAFWRHRVFTGAMRRYWNEGHNQNFILLKLLVENQNYITNVDDTEAEEYSGSFPRRANKIWMNLIAPFSQSDDSDFLDDEEQDSSYALSQPMFEKPESIEDELIRHLRNKREKSRGRSHGYDSSSGESQDEDEDSVLSIGDADSYVQESDSSEDEWVISKLAKKRGKKAAPEKRRRRIKTHSHLENKDDDIVDLSDGGKYNTNTGQMYRLKKSNWSSGESDEDTSTHSVRKNDIAKRRRKKVIIIESDDD